MLNLNTSTIALALTPEQREALNGHYGHLLQQLENGRPLSPPLVDGLRQAMRQALEAQPGMAELLAAARTQHQLVQLTHADNALLNLPWRLAVEDLPHLYLTKGLPNPRQNEQARQNPLPLKVLVMISAPEDTHARLSYEAEEDRIIQAFGPLYEHGQVQVDFTEDGALPSLQRKLKDNHYHILHFSGHGSYRDGQGWLELEDELRMEKQLTSAADFAAALNAKPEHCPALVLLSSCQTAQGAKEETFKGVSNQLLEIGVPAVVAMGLSISDYFATEFASKLYQELAEKEPLHRAFQSAIRHIQQEEARLRPQQLPAQWMIPQLYTNGSVSGLADWKAAFTPLTFQNYKFITGQHALLLQRHEGYQFLGRRKERKQALPLLADKQPVLLRGQGGVGKTALAEHLVHRLALQDGRLQPFVFNETTARLEDVIKALQAYLRSAHKRILIEVETKKYSDKAMEQFLYLLQEILQVCNPCFVFDNLETFQSEPGGPFALEHSDTKEVIAFLYQNRLCPLLLTGRYPLADFPEAVEVDLNQVRFADFLKKCQQLGLDRLLDKPAEAVLKKAAPPSFRALAQQLHQSFGGNYRALEFFDRLYRQHQGQAESTLATLHDYLEQYQGEVLHEMSENLVFNQLLALLTEAERRCLGLMYHFRRPVLPLAIAMQEAGLPDEEAALERLVQLTLLERQTEPLDTQQALTYYYLTPLVRGMMAQVEMERPAFAEEKAGDYYYHVDKTINHRNYGDLQEAWQHYYAAGHKARVNEIGDVLCTFYWNTSQFQLSYHYGQRTEQLLGADTHVRIYNNLGLLLHLYGQYDAALPYFEKSLAVKRAKEDRAGEGTTLSNISGIYKARGDYERALQFLEQSLNIMQQIGDRAGEGATLNNISQIYQARGEYDRALQFLQQSLNIQQQIGDRKGEGVTLNNISQIYQARGDYDRALQFLEQSLSILQQIGDRAGEGVTLNNISQIYKARGDYERALQFLEQSLNIMQQIGDRAGEGATLNNISQIYKARGEYDRALQFLQQSLNIQQQIGDRKGEGVTLNNISQIYQARGDYERALQFLEQSLKIQKQIGDRAGEGTTLNNISQIYKAGGDYERALQFLEQSLNIRQQIGDRAGEGTTLNNISQIYKARGDYDRALQFLEQSLEIRQQIGDRAGEGATLNNMATTAYARGDYERALQFLEQSLEIQQQIGDRAGEGATLNNISQIYKARGDYERALRFLEQSLKIQQQIGDRAGEGTTLNNMATTAYARGDYERALHFLEQSLEIQQQIGDRAGEGTTLNNLAGVSRAKGDLKQTLAYLEQSFNIQQQIGDVARMATSLHNIGVTNTELEQWEAAVRPLIQAYQIREQLQSPELPSTISYLNALTEKLGQARVQQILQQQNG